MRLPTAYLPGSRGLKAGNVSVTSQSGKVDVDNLFVEGTLGVTTTFETDGFGLSQLKKGGPVAVTGATARRVVIETKDGKVTVKDVSILTSLSELPHGIVVTTTKGAVSVEDGGQGTDIVVSTVSGDVSIVLSGKAFSGRYNLQTQEGEVYVNPTNNMHEKGPECSATDQWMGLPTLREGVSRMNGHCEQGQVRARDSGVVCVCVCVCLCQQTDRVLGC